jgi:DNA/RNA endonuclease YhcR with UshA esterase domain
METPYEYIDLPFTVKGTVDAIYEDSNNHTDIKIKDDDGNVYLFYYQSEDVNNFASANIPSLSEGDNLSITGIFSSIQNPEDSTLHLYEHMSGSDYNLDSLKKDIQNNDFIETMDKLSQKDTENDEALSALLKMSEVNDPDLEKIFPIFNSVTADVIGNDCDPMNLQNTYQEICDNPFYYIDTDISLDGTVVYENFDADSSKLTLLVNEKGTSNVYAVTYKAENFNSILNKELHITGKLSNTHRVTYYNDETKSLGYVIYPLITATEVTE